MWRRLPVWIRAIVTGMIVTGVPAIVWAMLATINLRLTPRVPWSAPLMAGLLWVYWRYLRGEGRSEYLRATALAPRAWRLSLIGGGSAIAAVWALFAAFRGVMHIAAPSNDLTRFPVWTILAAIVMGSAVAGVAEEAGFRGYMQVPLERAYGPVVAIATTSVLFTLVHLTHGTRIFPFLPFYLAVAVVYGLLAFLTGSILPSMTLHFVGDVLMFAMRYIAARQGVAAATGNIALGYAIVAAGFVVLSVLMFRLLARSTRMIAPASRIPATGH
jgi:membrane protease YdiL (CAAX protease family)